MNEDLENYGDQELKISLLNKEQEDYIELVNNKQFQRGIKLIIMILMMIGLVIGKIWMTVCFFKKNY